MKKYLQLIKLFFEMFKALRSPQFESFNKRKLGKEKGYGLLKKPLEGRFQQNQKGKATMTQKDLFLYLTITAFQEPQKELKQELFLPFMLLFMIYCNEKDSE